MVTGKEEDGKAALAAEASLKDAIDQSMKGTTNPARLEQVAQAGAGIPRPSPRSLPTFVKVKDESARITQNQLTRSGMSLHYKVDDLPSNADESEQPVIQSRRQESLSSSFRPSTALVNTFVVNSDKTVAASALARLKFVENSLKSISVEERKGRR